MDGLPSPTLNDLPPRPVNEDESVIQLVLEDSVKPTPPPDAANAPALSPPSAATPTTLPEVTQQPVSAVSPLPRIAIRLLGRGMNRPAAPTTRAQDEPTDIDEEDEDADEYPTRMPIHLRILSTTFRTYQIIHQSRHAQANEFAMEEGVEIELC